MLDSVNMTEHILNHYNENIISKELYYTFSEDAKSKKITFHYKKEQGYYLK